MQSLPWAELRASRVGKSGINSLCPCRKEPFPPQNTENSEQSPGNRKREIHSKVLNIALCSHQRRFQRGAEPGQARLCPLSPPEGFVSAGNSSRLLHPRAQHLALDCVTHCSGGACPGTGNSSPGSRSSRALELLCHPCCPRAPRCEPRGAGSWSP